MVVALLISRSAASDAADSAESARTRWEAKSSDRVVEVRRDSVQRSPGRPRQKKRTSPQDIAIDPRLLVYRDMVAAIEAAKDTAARAEEVRARKRLVESVTQLVELDADLQRLERVLADQRARLDRLERDFAGQQQTALAIVVSGFPKDEGLGEITMTLADGVVIAVPISEERRESLRNGAVIQVFNGLVPPQSQVIEIVLGGGRWKANDVGYVTIEPPRDRLTLLRLDLSSARPDQGAPGIRASVRQEPSGRTLLGK